MARIQIVDLPGNQEVSPAVMRNIRGGVTRNYVIETDMYGNSYVLFGDGINRCCPGERCEQYICKRIANSRNYTEHVFNYRLEPVYWILCSL